MKRYFILGVCLALVASGASYADNAPSDAKTPTSMAYVTSQLDTVQNSFAGNGANKLMTYPTTAGGTPGSRDIVTTLGTPNAAGQYTNTTDNTIATRGAVLAGINAKQDTLTGTSGYAVLGTGTDGVVDEKAIYGAQTQFNTALVETGTLNSAVIAAVNSELIRVNENGVADPNGTLWKLNDALTLLTTGNAGISGGGGNSNQCPDESALLSIMTNLSITTNYGYEDNINTGWKNLRSSEYPQFSVENYGSYYGDDYTMLNDTGLSPGEWKKSGVRGRAICKDLDGDNPDNSPEAFDCYCQITGFDDGTTSCSITSNTLYWLEPFGDYEGECLDKCAIYCTIRSFNTESSYNIILE